MIKPFAKQLEERHPEFSIASGRAAMGPGWKGAQADVALAVAFMLGSGRTRLHLEIDRSGGTVRVGDPKRLDELARISRPAARSMLAAMKVMSGMGEYVNEHRLPLDGSINWKSNGTVLRIGVSVLSGAAGESVVMKVGTPVTPTSGDPWGLDSWQRHRVLRALEGTGLVLIEDADETRRRETLYDLVVRARTQQRKAMTVEDRAHRLIDGVHQSVVNASISRLRLVQFSLWQDPDVLGIDSIDDAAVRDAAVAAALGDTLVIAGTACAADPSLPFGVLKAVLARAPQAGGSKRRK